MDANSKKQEIVVVDDEEHLRDMVADYLNGQGYSTRTASGGKELDLCLEEYNADLILLDVNMPGEDGFSVARRIRAASRTPIIMLTATDDVVDKIVGLEIGADDYVTKPFDLKELKARIRAVLRRAQPAGREATGSPLLNPSPPSGLAAFGRLFVDSDGRRLLSADGSEEAVTAMEFELIEVFLANPNRVLTRDRLLDLAHRKNDDPFDRSVDIRVTRLRKKIEEDPAKPLVIKTVRGVGYMYSPGKKT